MIVRFIVDGIPVGQPRTRACIRGKHAGVYTPETAKPWRQAIAIAASPHRPASPLLCPVEVIVNLCLPRPQRLMRKQDPDEVIPATCKPDNDNAIKVVLDALTDIRFWRDDAQAWATTLRKWYCSKTGRPGATIELKWDERLVP